ncbi:unnamed protein product, partial [Phaeothamnion confervicola]
MGDKLMAMPFFYTTKALIFNTENLAKAKVKALPATWDQVAKIAEKMVDPKAPTGLVPLALSVQGTSEQNARTLQILAWQSGADGIAAPGPTSDDAAQKATALVLSWKKFLA